MKLIDKMAREYANDYLKHGHQRTHGKTMTDWLAGFRAAREMCAQREESAATSVHAPDAKWMGPQRQYYEGARPAGVDASPMNGPAIAYDGCIARAAAIRLIGEAEEGNPTRAEPCGS